MAVKCLGKESACNAGDLDSKPGSQRSPGEGNGYPLQYSYLGIPWTEELGGYSPRGRRVGHDSATNTHTFTLGLVSGNREGRNVTYPFPSRSLYSYRTGKIYMHSNPQAFVADVSGTGLSSEAVHRRMHDYDLVLLVEQRTRYLKSLSLKTK